jgi:hypothetical protein
VWSVKICIWFQATSPLVKKWNILL